MSIYARYTGSHIFSYVYITNDKQINSTNLAKRRDLASLYTSLIATSLWGFRFPSALFRRSTMSPTKDPVILVASKITGIAICENQAK